MPRVCNRAGCGTLLLKPDGTPDYRRANAILMCLIHDGLVPGVV